MDQLVLLQWKRSLPRGLDGEAMLMRSVVINDCETPTKWLVKASKRPHGSATQAHRQCTGYL